MRDLIEKQAAIDVLSLGKEILSRVLDDKNVVGIEREKYLYGLKLIESNIKDIEELPSVQSERKMCNLCKYYEGVHRVQGHAPCSFWKIGGVMYDDYCSRWEKSDE